MNQLNDNPNTPAELRPIEASIEELGRVERAAAPASLEQGVFLASLRHLNAAEAAPLSIVTRPLLGRFVRMAAAVAVVGAVVGIWAMSGGRASATTTNGLEDDVNFVLDLRSSADELAILGERIDSLYLDTTTVRDSLGTDATNQILGDGAL